MTAPQGTADYIAAHVPVLTLDEAKRLLSAAEAEIAALRAAPLDVNRLGEAFTAAWGWSPTHAWQQAQRVAREYAALATAKEASGS